MADVTATFAARDESFSATVTQLQNRLNSFQGGLQGFNNEVANIGATFTKIGAAVTGVIAIFQSVRAAVDSFQQALAKTDALNDFANRVNDLPGNLALLQTAFQNAGSSADALEPAINRLNNELGKASSGSEEAKEKFTNLGLNFEQLKTQSPTEQLIAIGNAIRELPTPADQTAAAIGIFGRNTASLVNVLTQLVPELQNAGTQLGSYPDILNNSAAAMGRLKDNLVQVQDKINQFTTGALSALEPLLANIAKAAARVDFAGLGQRLGDTLRDAIDSWIGLLSMKGPEIAKLLLGNMQDSIRIVADFLADNLARAFSSAGEFFNKIFSSGAISDATDYLANALINAAANFGVKLIETFQSVSQAVSELLSGNAAHLQNVFAQAFNAVLNALSSDFVQFLSNPVAFVANEFARSLTSAATATAEDFRSGYNSAFGGVVEGLKSGLINTSETTKANMDSAASTFKDKVVFAAEKAAEKSAEVNTDFFDAEGAAKRIDERFTSVREAGQSVRADIEAAAQASGSVSFDINTSAKDAGRLERSYDESRASMEVASLRTSDMSKDGQRFARDINSAKGDVRASVDLMAGPNGLTDRFNKAMQNTRELKDVLGTLKQVGRDDANMRRTERDADSDMRRYERKEDIASDLERRGQWGAADNRRQNAQADFEREQRENLAEMYSEAIRQEAYERAQQESSLGKRLDMQRDADEKHEERMSELQDKLDQQEQDTANEANKSVMDAAKSFWDKSTQGGENVRKGGRDAAEQLRDAARNFGRGQQQAGLALESTLIRCEEFLRQINEKLPQHALT